MLELNSILLQRKSNFISTLHLQNGEILSKSQVTHLNKQIHRYNKENNTFFVTNEKLLKKTETFGPFNQTNQEFILHLDGIEERMSHEESIRIIAEEGRNIPPTTE